ncbi:hypothetical protein C8Q79DRAFT_915055 [Trametes meyenii]|nr:hypothetical protein C8Q79DRAFT_915055 [Trametes meyenii]
MYPVLCATDVLTHTLSGKRKAEDDSVPATKKVKTANGDAVAAGNSEGTKTIFVGKLSWNVDNDWLAQEFAECGEVTSARVQTDRNTGKSRGFGFVTFATSEAVEAAVSLNGKEIDGRAVNIDKSEEKDKSAVREKRAQAFGDSPSEPSSVLFVGNLSWNATEDKVWEVFGAYGDVKSVRLPTDRETERPKGFGYVEFTDLESAKKAFENLAGSEIDGRMIRLDYSQPRDNNGGGGGGFRGRGRVSSLLFHVLVVALIVHIGLWRPWWSWWARRV